jgi:hypothetical protein
LVREVCGLDVEGQLAPWHFYTIPISFGFGRVWKFEGPEVNAWVSGEWTAYRQYTNITPMYTVRFGLTLLFPNFEL